MGIKKSMIGILSAVALSGAVFSTSATAAEEQRFSALQGVEAQALSAAEMDAVYGALTSTEIAARFYALVNNSTLSSTLKKGIILRFNTYILPRLQVLYPPNP